MIRLRILHVIAEMGTGGAESLVAELVRGGASHGWSSAVASAGGFQADLLQTEGFPQYQVPLPRRTIAGLSRASRALRAAVRDFGPDIVVAHNVSASAVARLSQWMRPRTALVTVFHGVAEADHRLSARLLRLSSRKVVVVSGATAARLVAAGVRASDITVIPNAVTGHPLPDRRQARAKLGIDPDVPVALCLARLEPQKRHDVLLDAWQRLEAPAVLLLAGDGSARAELEASCPGQRRSGRIRFLGARSDVPTLLAAADITVLTSDWEGLPIALLESLAAGRPVVATDVGGVGEVLGSGGGRVVPPRDPRRTADALSELLFDVDARAAAAAAGSAHVRATHDPATMLAAYDGVFRTEVSVHSRGHLKKHGGTVE